MLGMITWSVQKSHLLAEAGMRIMKQFTLRMKRLRFESANQIYICIFLVLTHQYDNSPESNAQQIQFGRRIEDTIR